MIIDRIEEQERYYALHKDMELAFAFLAEAADLEEGRYELENGLFASVFEGETRQINGIDLEAHKEYIDLQYCISGGERMAWAHIQELNKTTEEPESDCYFYNASPRRCPCVRVCSTSCSPAMVIRPAAIRNSPSATARWS